MHFFTVGLPALDRRYTEPSLNGGAQGPARPGLNNWVHFAPVARPGRSEVAGAERRLFPEKT
jgi:hypothetical protein